MLKKPKKILQKTGLFTIISQISLCSEQSFCSSIISLFFFIPRDKSLWALQQWQGGSRLYKKHELIIFCISILPLKPVGWKMKRCEKSFRGQALPNCRAHSSSENNPDELVIKSFQYEVWRFYYVWSIEYKRPPCKKYIVPLCIKPKV